VQLFELCSPTHVAVDSNPSSGLACMVSFAYVATVLTWEVCLHGNLFDVVDFLM